MAFEQNALADIGGLTLPLGSKTETSLQVCYAGILYKEVSGSLQFTGTWQRAERTASRDWFKIWITATAVLTTTSSLKSGVGFMAPSSDPRGSPVLFVSREQEKLTSACVSQTKSDSWGTWSFISSETALPSNVVGVIHRCDVSCPIPPLTNSGWYE